MAPYFNNSGSDKQIRIISALCYMSFGVVGLIYVLLNGKNNQSMFLRFHFVQSILLGCFYTLLNWLNCGMGQFFSGVFGLIGGAGANIGVPVLMGLSYLIMGVQAFIIIGCVYGLIWALRGKYADMPVVSKIVRNNVR